MSDIILENYRNVYVDYLSKTSLNQRKSNELHFIIRYSENDLFNFLQKYFNIKSESIYEVTDKSLLKKVMDSIDFNQDAKEANDKSEGMIKTSLQYYIGFQSYRDHYEEKIFKKQHKKDKRATTTQPSIPEPQSYDKLEGAKHTDEVTRYERDQANRKACIAHYGYVCQVCGMNFEQVYGELGKEFIEVHHRYPVSQGERKVNPIEDLVALCSNCHSMIHRQENVADWEGLKAKLKKEWSKD